MAIKVDGLAKAIAQELQTYTKEIIAGMNESGDKIAKDGAKTLRKTSPKKHGRYRKGWTVKKEVSFGGVVGFTVHNKDRYQLTHLLEKGHAKRGGGRTKAIVHIAPVEEKLISDYLAGVERVIKGG